MNNISDSLFRILVNIMDHLFSAAMDRIWDNSVGASRAGVSNSGHRQPSTSAVADTTPAHTAPTATVSTTTAATSATAPTAAHQNTIAAPGFTQPGNSAAASPGIPEQAPATQQAEIPSQAPAGSSIWEGRPAWNSQLWASPLPPSPGPFGPYVSYQYLPGQCPLRSIMHGIRVSEALSHVGMQGQGL